MALPKDVKFVTFDCYGTLIDWESGVYDAFQKEADRDGFISTDRPDDVHALLHRGRDDLRRREPDALVDHLEADVAGAHGHLLGAVGVAVEPRLADEHAQRACPAPRRWPAPARARPAISRGRPLRRRAADTPVGARNSPNTSRSTPAHSPVVTPAFAQAIEASMRLASVLAASRSPSSAASTAAASRSAFHAADRLDGGGLHGRVDRLDRRGPLGLQRARLGGLEAVHPDHDVVARLHPPPPLRQRRDELPLHVPGLDGRDRAAHLLHPVDLGLRLGDELGDLGLDHRASRRRGPRTPAGRSRRRAPAACAAPTAGPTAAAGRAPRSRRAAGSRGRGRRARA